MLSIYNEYLFKCDLLYKRNQKSVRNFLKFKTLTFKMSLYDFTNEVSLFSSLKFSELDNYNKLVLLYYVNYFLRPKVIFKKLKNVENINCLLVFKLFKNNISKFLFSYFFDLYIHIFESVLQRATHKIDTERSKEVFFKGNLINDSQFHLHLNEILDLVNLKRLSFFIYLNFKY